jgi:hypothetical protein
MWDKILPGEIDSDLNYFLDADLRGGLPKIHQA